MLDANACPFATTNYARQLSNARATRGQMTHLDRRAVLSTHLLAPRNALSQKILHAVRKSALRYRQACDSSQLFAKRVICTPNSHFASLPAWLWHGGLARQCCRGSPQLSLHAGACLPCRLRVSTSQRHLTVSQVWICHSLLPHVL